MKPRLFILMVNLALLAAWAGQCGWTHGRHSWPDGS
jgi:hypothetical protein